MPSRERGKVVEAADDLHDEPDDELKLAGDLALVPQVVPAVVPLPVLETAAAQRVPLDGL